MNRTRVVRGLASVLCLGLAIWGCSQDAAIPQRQEEYQSPQEKFFQATATGDVPTLESMLASDPSLLGIRGLSGMTPLHSAAAAGQNDAVTFLLEHGANPLVLDEDSNDAAGAAMTEGHKDTAQIINDWIAEKRAGAQSP